MDRFIAYAFTRSTSTKNCLKSNMDRFIEGKPGEWYQDKCMFKIQYG